jgi:hypothetical protein
MFLLPSYSPQLNPDELLNHDVKANAVGRKRARTKQETIENLRRYLRRRQRQPDVVQRFFHEKHVAYAAQGGVHYFMLWLVPLYPTKNICMVNIQAALIYHLRYLSVGKRVAQVPTHAQQDNFKLIDAI